MRLLPVLALTGCFVGDECLSALDVVDVDTSIGELVLVDEPSCAWPLAPNWLVVNRFATPDDDLCSVNPDSEQQAVDIAYLNGLKHRNFPIDLDDEAFWSDSQLDGPGNVVTVLALREGLADQARLHPSWNLRWRIGEPDSVVTCW